MSGLIRMKAIAGQFMNGKPLRVGDEFDVPEGEAADLVALHFAVRVPTVANPVVAPTYETRALDSEDSSEAEAHGKRTYKRRDLTAEK